MEGPLLILLPNLLHEEGEAKEILPPIIGKKLSLLTGLIAESEKTARRYVRLFLPREEAAKIPIHLYNEHTTSEEFQALVAFISQGVWGLISDAGVPCIADPGHELVKRAKQKGIKVEAVAGPCSPLLALMLSGLEGQRFAFHGYLPREEKDLRSALSLLEKRSREEKSTQLWIEAPYRSERMLALLKEALRPETLLSVAKNLSSPLEEVVTLPIREWKKSAFVIGKEPAIFLIYSLSN